MTGDMPDGALTVAHGEAGSALLADVEDFIGQYVAFPSEAARIAGTLWAAHTHALDCFDSTPRLALLSPEPGSGKTRVLEVLESLAPNPLHSLSASPAAVFRLIDAERPTLLCDEVDNLFGKSGRDDDNADLRGLLNAGHRRGATIPRCVGPRHEVHRFPVVAAVALAGLGDLPETLMSRAVIVRMRRRAPNEHIEPWRQRTVPPIGHLLRDRLAAWTEANTEALKREPAMPPGVTDRPADVWEPLLAVADAAGGDWPGRARAACVELSAPSVAREASLGVKLLADLRTVFDGEQMATAAILERLHALDESPWADLRGRPLDARGLARILGGYSIESTKVRIGASTPRGYRREDLYDAWLRYLPASAEQPEQPEHPRSAGANRVPDGERVPEHAPETEQSSTAPTWTVPPVPDVPHLRGSGGPDPGFACPQCGRCDGIGEPRVCLDCWHRNRAQVEEP